MKLSETTTIGDKILTTLKNSEVEFDAIVTGIDDEMELVFITIIENQEEIVVAPKQIIANFGPDTE